MLNLVFRYYCNGMNVERVRRPTVSLGAAGPREFDLLTPAAQHNLLFCVILKYGINVIEASRGFLQLSVPMMLIRLNEESCQ